MQLFPFILSIIVTELTHFSIQIAILTPQFDRTWTTSYPLHRQLIINQLMMNDNGQDGRRTRRSNSNWIFQSIRNNEKLTQNENSSFTRLLLVVVESSIVQLKNNPNSVVWINLMSPINCGQENGTPQSHNSIKIFPLLSPQHRHW